MARMITGEQLQEAVRSQTFIRNGSEKSAEGVKYDFTLSSRILKAKFKLPVDASQLDEASKRELVIDPGEVVFVLTQERLALPMDMVAYLSPKRKLSHAGILTLGGFCIDPGYDGFILLGLFNLSSTPFPLRPGKKLIAATFSRLEGDELDKFPVPPEALDDFPDELVQVMQKYEPVAAQSLADKVVALQADLTALKNDIRSHEEWYRRLKEAIDSNNEQIRKLTEDLSDEKDVRKSGQDELTRAVQGIQTNLTFLRGAAWVLMGILGVAVAILIGLAVARLL